MELTEYYTQIIELLTVSNTIGSHILSLLYVLLILVLAKMLIGFYIRIISKYLF